MISSAKKILLFGVILMLTGCAHYYPRQSGYYPSHYTDRPIYVIPHRIHYGHDNNTPNHYDRHDRPEIHNKAYFPRPRIYDRHNDRRDKHNNAPARPPQQHDRKHR